MAEDMRFYIFEMRMGSLRREIENLKTDISDLRIVLDLIDENVQQLKSEIERVELSLSDVRAQVELLQEKLGEVKA
jgi:chromosome segregation ATPase